MAPLVVSCDEASSPRASGAATIDGIYTEFPHHVQVYEYELDGSVTATVETRDGTERLDVSAPVGGSSVSIDCADGTALITYFADGHYFQAGGLSDGDCSILVTSGTGDGDGFVSMYLSGTLVDASNGDTVTLSNSYVTIERLD